jgi:transaldolase
MGGLLARLHPETGQSAWIDNLSRDQLRSGRLADLVARGVRGVTSNPSIFDKAIAGSGDYDGRIAELAAAGASMTDIYLDLVLADVRAATDILAGVHRDSEGRDGFVSLEVDPGHAHDTVATLAEARRLHDALSCTNAMIKIPATPEGLPAIRSMIAEGRSVNVTLIFSLERHQQVMEAHLAGLEQRAEEGLTLSGVHSVASFFVSRVDTEVDARLDAIGDTDTPRGGAALAQARLAWDHFTRICASPRWQRLATLGASPQRPLWASTSTKNPAYPDTLYVDGLIGPDTVNTLPDATLEAFDDHGTIARTVDADPDGDRALLARISEAGIDMDDVARTLEEQGVAAFRDSFASLMTAIESKMHRRP